MSFLKKLEREVYPKLDDLLQEVRKKPAEPVRQIVDLSTEEAVAQILADDKRAMKRDNQAKALERYRRRRA